MALVICRECRTRISQHTEACPSCGCPCAPMTDEQYEAQVKKMEAGRAHDLKIWMWVIGGFVLLCIIKVELQGGCEAARQKQLEREDRDNKIWQAQQDRKAREEDMGRAREMWNRDSR